MKRSTHRAWRAVLFVLVGVLCGLQEKEGRAQQYTSLSSFDHFTVQDGLPSNRTRALLQDRQGFIWVGTEQGLVRYDGYNFEPIVLSGSDSSRSPVFNVGELFEDNSGSIWVGSVEGLIKLDPVSMQTRLFLSDSTNTWPLSHNNVFAIAQLDSSAVWIGTQAGLNRIEGESGLVTRFSHNPADSLSLCGSLVTSLVFDTENTLWVGTNEGLCSYDRRSSSFKYWPNLSSQNQTGSTDFIRSMYIDPENRLWIGTRNRLYAFNLSTYESEEIDVPFPKNVDYRFQSVHLLTLLRKSYW